MKTRSSLMLGVRLTTTLANTRKARSNSAQLSRRNSMTAIYSESPNQPAASACSCVKISESLGMRYWNSTTADVLM